MGIRGALWILSLFALALASAAESPLTRAEDVRRLPRTEAARQLPVVLEGVVTYRTNRPGGAFVIHDPSAGIYVETERIPGGLPVPKWPTGDESIRQGSVVRIEGVTGEGGFAPVVMPATLTVIGRAELPASVNVTLADLATGRWDCQRVEIRGVIRFARRSDEVEGIEIDLATGLGRLTVFMDDAGRHEATRLIDSEVILRGVAFHYFNNRGELLDPILRASGPDAIEVIEPGRLDPFEAPEVSLPHLHPFSPDGPKLSRTRVRGTVTLVQPGRFFHLQAGGHGVRVNTRQATPLEPGDVVEASGFVELENFYAELSEAVFRKTGRTGLPAALELDRAMVVERLPNPVAPGLGTFRDLDGRFVSVEGTLLQIDQAAGRLFLDLGNGTVPVELSPDKKSIPPWQPGTRLRVRGVCLVKLDYGYPQNRHPLPSDFHILLHDRSFIDVLREPSWWSAGRLGIALGVIGAVLLLSLAWVGMLRRKVRQRTDALAREIRSRHEEQVEFDATLRERQRLAADLHDGVEQSLTGVAFRVEAMVLQRQREIEDPSLLHQLRQALASLREEVRRSVWNLRSNALDEGGLCGALERLAQRLTSERDVPVEVTVTGDPRPIDDFTATQLLMLVQEAATNALKHARPTRVGIAVTFHEDRVELAVTDDGRGFEPAAAPGSAQGHFGMQGMRERAKRIGATLRWSTAPDLGTRVEAGLPLRVSSPPP